ncbi:MAG: 16S rRNA (cytosine(967)-C(5))-methyltransferase, partial [Pisciglobus halotolerans]|nr:16S rRNA (cytosine(967)-C(5))-methyltransferase [Pisciglobus halotolerans]
CTITNEENEQVISKFLKNQPNFSKVPIKVGENLQANIVDNALHIYPDDFNTDGFFICCLKRNS